MISVIVSKYSLSNLWESWRLTEKIDNQFLILFYSASAVITIIGQSQFSYVQIICYCGYKYIYIMFRHNKVEYGWGKLEIPINDDNIDVPPPDSDEVA